MRAGSPPQPDQPSEARTTRWQGTAGKSGQRAMALPTARAAIGEPTIAATRPVRHRLARRDLAHGSVHGGVEGREPTQVDRWQRAAGDRGLHPVTGQVVGHRLGLAESGAEALRGSASSGSERVECAMPRSLSTTHIGPSEVSTRAKRSVGIGPVGDFWAIPEGWHARATIGDR